jgi:hypothetical protein
MALEKQRRLQSVVLTGSGVLTRDIPKDTVIKRIQLRLSGSIVTTYASGTPVNRADGIFHSLVNNISVVANGGRFIKSVQPHLMRMQQFFNTGLQAERGSSAGAAEVDIPTVSGNFTFGTTGQTTTVAESLSLPFEFIWAKSEAERSLTWLDTRDLTSCEIRFSQNGFSSLQSAANTAPVVYSASTLQIDILLVEAVGVMPGAKFFDFRQTTKDIPFTAQVSAQQVEINRNNSLAGLWFYAKDGSGGSSSTASDRLASNSLLTDMVLKLNGSVDLKSTTFRNLRAENQARNGINTLYVSNVTPTDGVAHMNFINNSIADAVNTKQGVDSLFLFLSTNSASNTSYTNTAFVTIQTDEICEITQ